jgi:NAD+ diphosphatase
VTLIIASRPNVYSGNPLDRAHERRDDEAWIAAALRHPDTLYVPGWRARTLMRGVEEGKPEAVFITAGAAEKLHMAGGPWTFLGILDGRPIFAIDVSHVDDPLPLLADDVAKFAPLCSMCHQ